MNSKDKVSLIAFVVLVGFLFSIVYHYILGSFFKLGYPYNSFLFFPNNVFGDFAASLMQIKLPIPYEGGWTCVYLPFFYMFGRIFLVLRFEVVLVIFLLTTSLIIFYLNLYNIKNGAVKLWDIQQSLILTFMSFPFLFCWDRCNFEILVLVIVYFSLYLYRKKSYYLSALFLSFAVAMKPFSIFLIILFIKDKRFREAFLLIISIAIITFLSLLSMQGKVVYSFRLLINNLSYTQNVLPFDLSTLGFCDFGNSIFGALKFIYLITKSNFVLSMMRGYNVLVTILFVAISFSLFAFVKEFWKKTFLIFAMTCLFPYISADYRLIYFIIPLHFFIKSFSDNKKMDYLFCILFALLFIPKNYICYLTKTGYNGVIFDPLIIFTFVVLIIWQDFNEYWRVNNLKVQSNLVNK